MDESTAQALLEKNQKLIDMVIERAKRDFPEDIAVIGLTGSFSTGDFHQNSDLDLIIINNTDRGWEISSCFILGEVGYDIYCTPWETRIQEEAQLKSDMISCLVDLKILYVAKPEYLDRLKEYQRQARDSLAKPIGRECLDRARQRLDLAKQALGELVLSKEPGPVTYRAGQVLYHCINAIVQMNNTYFKRGVKRYVEELRALPHLPLDFEEKYFAVIRGESSPAKQTAACRLLESTQILLEEMEEKFCEKPIPGFDNLRGTYEELWCNTRNKLLKSIRTKDVSYAFHAAMGVQSYVDEMHLYVGLPKFDFMAAFDPSDLTKLEAAFRQICAAYEQEYEKAGRQVSSFSTFTALYRSYMG